MSFTPLQTVKIFLSFPTLFPLRFFPYASTYRRDYTQYLCLSLVALTTDCTSIYYVNITIDKKGTAFFAYIMYIIFSSFAISA